MAGGKAKIIEFKNVETHHCIIAESILRNILNDWQKKWEQKYNIETSKAEKTSWLMSFLGMAVTLWVAFCTSNFESDFVDAVFFLASIVATIACVVYAYKTYKAYQVENVTINTEDIIKEIEKRTE